MWKRFAVLVSLALVLTGCVGAPSDEPDTTAAEAPSVEDVAEAPTITAPQAAEPEPGETALLETVRGFRAVPILDSATDAQIIASGHEACAQLEAGTHLIDVKVIEGDDPTGEGVVLTKAAHAHLCPDAPMNIGAIP